MGANSYVLRTLIVVVTVFGVLLWLLFTCGVSVGLLFFSQQSSARWLFCGPVGRGTADGAKTLAVYWLYQLWDRGPCAKIVPSPFCHSPSTSTTQGGHLSALPSTRNIVNVGPGEAWWAEAGANSLLRSISDELGLAVAPAPATDSVRSERQAGR